MTWLYFLRERSEVFECFQQFFEDIKTQFTTVLKIYRFDNAFEFMSSVFLNFFHDRGIIHETSYAHTPNKNVVFERKHRHLLEVTQCFQLYMSTPKFYWHNAMT